MMGISATDALAPDKQHLVEQLIEECTESFGLDRAPRRGCHYYVDLSGNAAPMRLIERPTAREHIRYFGPDRAAAKVDGLIKAFRERGVIPSILNPGDTLAPTIVLDVLNHVRRYWAPTPPVRASERKRAVARISVVHGLSSILGMVSGVSNELDFDSGVETWTVEDESEGGFGAVITETDSDWLEIGSLLAVCAEESATWSIASVRRLSRPAAGTIRVGVEVLSRAEVKVEIAAVDSDGTKKELPALLLLSGRDGSAQREELDLVLPPESFTDGQNWVMRAFERPYVLTPRVLHERGEDYELARFRAQRSEKEP
jgi:hypothetical protein